MRVFFKQTNKQTEEEITEINQLITLTGIMEHMHLGLHYEGH